MPMKRRTSMLLAILLFLPITACGKMDEAPKDVIVNVKTDGYTTVEELEESSDIIVIGKSIEGDEKIVYTPANTITSFHIEEILKNDVQETKQDIRIFEGQAYVERKHEIQHSNGYEKMIKGNTYILYLKGTDSGYYLPLAVTFGKIALSNSEIEAGVTSKNLDECVIALHKQVQKKYSEKLV